MIFTLKRTRKGGKKKTLLGLPEEIHFMRLSRDRGALNMVSSGVPS